MWLRFSLARAKGIKGGGSLQWGTVKNILWVLLSNYIYILLISFLCCLSHIDSQITKTPLAYLGCSIVPSRQSCPVMRNVGDGTTWQVKGINVKPLLKIILQIVKPEGQSC